MDWKYETAVTIPEGTSPTDEERMLQAAEAKLVKRFEDDIDGMLGDAGL
jgi:hypothetical protein